MNENMEAVRQQRRVFTAVCSFLRILCLAFLNSMHVLLKPAYPSTSS